MLLKSKYVELTEQELKDTEGGFVLTVSGAIIGGIIAVGGLATGYYFGSK
ncbi:MAG: class IIb bacteriocin, lactobin A/cerein 7B family [Catonella sp.]|jgi:class IIb bacteriocin, lactobin A/cerein 7B family|nr:MAG: class IIb bacteriocin, lactobin A/cerein 7B family [Catonella sp.]